MEDTEGHVGKREAQLKRWGAKLDQLVAKAEKAGAEMKIERRKRIDDLKAKYQAAQSKLAELKAASGEKWGVLKTGVESAWNELEAAFKKLKN
jgi:DNA repair exonuclease SbcCD ATPase subunit